MNHILMAKQFTRKEVSEIFSKAESLRKDCQPLLKGYILATLFYEPSTRTRLSFEAAMQKLGGSVISETAISSSANKGESLQDTIRVVSSYCDVLVLRSPHKGLSQFIENSTVPVINAGDGDGEHPSQALLDVYTILRERSCVDGLHFALVGDLKYGRAVHSLIYLLGIYENIQLTLVSPEFLRLPEEIIKFMSSKGVCFRETGSLREALLEQPDVVYMTRIQTERMESYLENPYIFGLKEWNMLKKESVILHPLPRRSEISPEIDKFANAAYFRQAENGLWLRAGLLCHVKSL